MNVTSRKDPKSYSHFQRGFMNNIFGNQKLKELFSVFFHIIPKHFSHNITFKKCQNKIRTINVPAFP